MKISVFGLGYVGIVSAACFAKLGHKVIGVDLFDQKVDPINNGKSPIKEKDLNKIIEDHVIKKRLFATKDAEKAILNTEISFVCIGTPPKRNGDLDLSYLENFCKEVGKIIKKKKENHTIVIRSTIFPGSLEKLTKILEEYSGIKEGDGFNIAMNPEFLREGSAVEDFFNPPYIIVGAYNKNIGKKIFDSYSKIKSKKFLVKPNIAQMIKYANNSWHGLKVTFANEIGAICKKLGIDSKKLMKVFCEDNQLNLSSYYLKPGFAYGGSCLPKDTAALKINSEKLSLETPLINSISQSNLEHIQRAIDLVKTKNKKKVGILGLTFKSGTDDIRGNPILLVINKLLNEGYEIKIFDSVVDESDIESINESYRKEVFDLIIREDLKGKISDISYLFSSLEEVLEQDIILISNRDPSLKETLQKIKKNKTIIDFQNLFNKEEFEADYETL